MATKYGMPSFTFFTVKPLRSHLFEALAVRLALRFESRPKDILVSLALSLAKPAWEVVSLMNTNEI